ncbi:MAG TPA: hypothetical protein VFU82_05685 [Gammaproteobacteria bacterium]|nr:hypothetical protein [Gammaproteobacteria bacterium]
MTTWMHKPEAILGGLLLVWLGLVVGVLMPAMQTCDSLAADIHQQASHLALLQRSAAPGGLPVRAQVLFLGPDVLLRAARQAGLASVNVDDAKAGGYQLSGEASVSAFAAWLQLLSEADTGVTLSKVDLSVQADGRLHFVLLASEVGEASSLAVYHPWPLGNPFCHTASLQEALAEAAVPPIQRYPLSDIHWIGRAKLGRVPYVLLALPGGVTVSVSRGDFIGEARARVVGLSRDTITLRLPDGQVRTLKQERGN